MTRFGIDGAHHQEGLVANQTDWDAIDFVIWRASIGVKVDRTFATWKQAAIAHNKPFAAYHFVYPSALDRVPRYTPSAQANALNTALGGDRTIPVMIDWEQEGDGEWIQPTFADALRVTAAIRALGYRVPLLYTGWWYWDQMGRPTLSGHGFDLVNSNYGPGATKTSRFEAVPRYTELSANPNWKAWEPYGGLTPVIVQFGERIRWGTINGQPHYHDHDATMQPDLSKWFRMPANTPPPPPPDPIPDPIPQPIPTGDKKMFLIMKYGGTPTAGWGGWYSNDAGVSRRPVKSMAQAALIVDLGARDAKTKAVVTDREWDGVSHTANVATLDATLTPYK